MESGSGAAVAHVVGDVVLRLTCAVFIIVPPGACRMEVAEHLQEEQKADEVYTYKEGRGVDQFADAVAEAFKKAGGQIPRGGAPKHLRRSRAQEETGEEERPRRKSGGAVTPKYYAEYYKHIDKEARATKLIEVLTSEKPRVYIEM